MEKSEIIEGLKSAIDRGYSVELAISSFVNAGYNKDDVLDSAKSFFGGNFLVQEISSKPAIQPPPQQSSKQILQNQQPPQSTIQPLPTPTQPIQPMQVMQPKPRKKGIVLVILLVVILFLLISLLFTIVFAREFVSNLLSKIGLEF